MTNPNDRHRVYMSFIDRQGWQCQFLEAYLQTPLPKRLSAALAASERSGEAANAAGAPAPGSRPPVPDSEVIARPRRRSCTAEYRRSILDQADAAQRLSV
jgi:hypothetical protein